MVFPTSVPSTVVKSWVIHPYWGMVINLLMVFIYQAYGMDDPQPIYYVLIMAHTLWQTMFD